MSKLYRNKNSGNIWPEFKGTENQANYPKDWEEVDAEGNLVVPAKEAPEPIETEAVVSAPEIFEPAPSKAIPNKKK